MFSLATRRVLPAYFQKNYSCMKNWKNLFIPWKSLINNFSKYSIVMPGKVLKKERIIPPNILLPPYYKTGEPPASPHTVEVKDEVAIEGVRKSCQLASHILHSVGTHIKVGQTTDEIDDLVYQLTVDAGAYPSPLNYRGFPKSVCTSVNNVCCHGIPDDRPLQDGDIINVDITVYSNGYHGDCSKTFLVGNVDENGQKLVKMAEQCLVKGISVCRPGAMFSMIGAAIEELASSHGYMVLPDILGHGIGSYFHEPPEIVHICNEIPFTMAPGNIFTIEPALTEGDAGIEILEDGWTCITADNARTAQCEHTVLITKKGVEILTSC